MKQQIVKKVPLRKCVITGTQLPKKDMFRVVRTPEGNVEVDLTSKVRGHGVYLIKDKDVIEKAKKRHALDKPLEVKVPDEVYDELVRLVDNNE